MMAVEKTRAFLSLVNKLASYFNCDVDDVFPFEQTLPTATDKRCGLLMLYVYIGRNVYFLQH